MKAPSYSIEIPRLSIVAALVAICTALVVHAHLVYAPCDDAYIYLVYVKNFFSGSGFTYNHELVEGYSSILWPWLIAVGHLLGLDFPRAMEFLSLLSSFSVVGLSFWIAHYRLQLSAIQALFPSLLLTASGDFAFYAGNGLETVAFSGVVLLITSYLFRVDQLDIFEKNSALILLFISPLVRPEGLLVSGLVAGWICLVHRNFKAAFFLFIKLSILLAPIYFSLRVIYGYWLPTTYYAKSGAGFSNIGQGFHYSFLFLKYYWPVIILLFAALIFRGKETSSVRIPLLLVLVAWAIQVSIQGGDNMVGFRMYLPILPIIYIFIAYAFRFDSKRLLLLVGIGVGAYLFAEYNFGSVAGSAWSVPVQQHANSWRTSFRERKAVGQWLKRSMPKNSEVALGAAGITPYYSGLPTIDMFGLNNDHIALYGKRDRALTYGHQAGDGDYVLQRRPGAIWLSWGLEPGPFVSDREIWTNVIFHKDYIACKVTLDTWLWLRKDLLVEIKAADKDLLCNESA